MNKLNVIINEKGIERITFASTSEGEEERLLSLYKIISKDLRKINRKISKTNKETLYQ